MQSNPAPPVRRYRAFGFTIASQVELPQLPPGAASDSGDVEIVLGPVEPVLRSARGLRIGRLPGHCWYQVVEGRSVTVEVLPGAAPKNVSDFVLSRVLTAVCYQRGLLPLHASAVSTPGGVMAICGPSGAGKSTLAAALSRRGHPVFADDMVTLSGPQTPPLAAPGARGLKLSQVSLDHVGASSEGLTLANEVEGKFFLPLEHDPDRRPAPLSALVRLVGGPCVLKSLSSLAALAEWKNCIRHPELISEAPDPSVLWRRWVELVARTPVILAGHGRRMDGVAPIVDYLDAFARTGLAA